MRLFIQLVRERRMSPARHRLCSTSVLAFRALPDDGARVRTSLRGLLLLPGVLLLNVLLAQPQWRFHLAFEDATGAKDTIWYVYDTTATQGSQTNPQVDEQLGEGATEMNLDVFNVWLWNWDGDSTKTLAYPYSSFPWHGEQEIRGFNYQFPITIRWDRSLLQAPYLPNPAAIDEAFLAGEYFYWFGNQPFPGIHSILQEDSVVVQDQGWAAPLFPFSLSIHGDLTNGVHDLAEAPFGLAVRWPYVEITMAQRIHEVRILDASGQLRYQAMPMTSHTEIPIAAWADGLYIVAVRTSTNTWHHGKFLKVAP